MGAQNHKHDQTELGTNIMVAGILFQLAAMTLYCTCVTIFAMRVAHARLKFPASVYWLCWGNFIVTAMIYVRGIYRAIELLGGWSGKYVTHEIYFVLLDELPMIFALVSFNLFHPGMYLPSLMNKDAEDKVKGSLHVAV